MVVIEIETEIIRGRIFVAQITEDDIYHLNYSPNEISKWQDFKEGHEAYDKLRYDRKLKAIIEIGKFNVIDKSATEYLKTNKFEVTAAAIVLHSIAQRIVYNFYKRFINQDYPIRAFESFENARNWLLKL